MRSTIAVLSAAVSLAASLGAVPSTAAAATRIVRCESQDQRRGFCPVPWANDVRIGQQLSMAPCDRGRTWGFEPRRRTIWVAGGCRADFVVYSGDDRGYGDGGYGDRSYGDRGYGDRGYGDRGRRDYTVRCESQDRGHNECAVDSAGPVNLSQQLSDAPCVRGRTWGFEPNRRRIWVDGGCRADFDVH
jgi:hypothetical protein